MSELLEVRDMFILLIVVIDYGCMHMSKLIGITHIKYEQFFFVYLILILSQLVQFSSVTQSCPTLCNPMDCSTPGFFVHHQLPELAQTHVL